MEKVELSSMSFMAGFAGPPSERKEGWYQVDWDKAKRFILENEADLEMVNVGLAEDWECTQAPLWNEDTGFYKEDRAEYSFYGASVWATPAINVFWKNGEEEAFECWKSGDHTSFVNLNETGGESA